MSISKEDKLAALQVAYMDEDIHKSNREALHESWFQTDTVDYWRHERMYETMRPFALHFKHAAWATIGDGRYGLDAVRLANIFGIQELLPTDIASAMMKVAQERGLIKDFQIENAEHLSFENDSKDILFCKEAFHHFPRPYLALYEMLRVAREAVVMIEPAERLIADGVKSGNYIKSSVKLFFSKLFRRATYPYIPGLQPLEHKYEEAGNYLYAVSVRELEKLVHGMDLADMAYLRFNDAYIKGVEFEKKHETNSVFNRLQTMIKHADEQSEKYPRYHMPNMVTVVIFKKQVPQSLRQSMIDAGFVFINKMNNPYL